MGIDAFGVLNAFWLLYYRGTREWSQTPKRGKLANVGNNCKMIPQMNKYLIIAVTLLMTGCIESNQPKFLPIDPKELIFQKGDCISFNVDSINKGAAIVIDYSKDEGGLWYGLCFTDYLDSLTPNLSQINERKIFGRKIESSLDKNGFIIGLDLEFVNDSCIKLNKTKFQNIGNLSLRNEIIKYGAYGASNDYSKMLYVFHRGIEKRITPPDDYREHRTKLNNFRPEEYFLLKDYIY